MTSATVIIPTHNRRALIRAAVMRLLEQDFDGDLQVIVVTDRCEDGTGAALREEFGDRILVLDAARPGSSGAINTGIAMATGDVVIIMDDEMQAVRDFVRSHVNEHSLHPDLRLAVTGYSPVALDSKAADPLHAYLAEIYSRYHGTLAAPNKRLSPADLNAGNMSIALAHLREVGGFNESYFFARNDFELATRLIERGFEIRFCERARADQHLGVTSSAMVSRAEPRARADVRLAREHPWCLDALPFSSQLTDETSKKKWRAAWAARGAIGLATKIASAASPRSLAPVRYAYAARYAIEVVRAAGGWQEFENMLSTREPWPQPLQ